MNGLTAQPMKGEQLMKITLEGEPKEIAALVLAVQERQLSELKEGVCVDGVLIGNDLACAE